MNIVLGLILCNLLPAAPMAGLAEIAPKQVTLADQFWRPRLETNREVTLPHNFRMCEETGRIRNFAVAGGLEEGAFEGIPFNDSDVFKVMEGAAYILATSEDAELDAYLDDLIAKIAAAQEADGYLYTARTILQTGLPDMSGETRWSHLAHSHELYNVGHMYEAAAAHYEATGKRNFLDIAIKNAELILEEFGPEGRQDPPGHQEIELGLVRLYEVTNDARYLELARFFVDARGRTEGRNAYGWYAQDHAPIAEQSEAVGHAVRAGYYYAAVAELARVTGDAPYRDAMDRIWDDVVGRKLYLTGGLGSRREHEGFGEAYELANATAFNETCAAIANIFWNWRMFLLHADGQYLDVLERSLYNGFLAGVHFNGTHYFYPNPLASDGEWTFNHGSAERQPWFDCSCCPVNVVRFLPQVPGYFYAQQDDAIYVNLYGANRAELTVADQPIAITQETKYPWEGDVTLSLALEDAAEFTLHLRIPGWARDKPVPSDLYRYEMPQGAAPTPMPAITINGESVDAQIVRGYARIQRSWEDGDQVQLRLPFEARIVHAHEQVEANQHRVAIERGPLVYCVEGADNDGRVLNTIMHSLHFQHELEPDAWAGVTKIHIHGFEPKEDPAEDEVPVARARVLQAIPYYAWGHRGANEMQVWIEDGWSRQQELLRE